jgi:hypothetical protein
MELPGSKKKLSPDFYEATIRPSTRSGLDTRLNTPSGQHAHGAAPNPNDVLRLANQSQGVTPGSLSGAPRWRGDNHLEQLTRNLARVAHPGPGSRDLGAGDRPLLGEHPAGVQLDEGAPMAARHKLKPLYQRGEGSTWLPPRLRGGEGVQKYFGASLPPLSPLFPLPPPSPQSMHEEENRAPDSLTGGVPLALSEAKQPVPPCHGEEAPKVDNLSPSDADDAGMMGGGSNEVAPSPHNQSNALDQSSGHGRRLEEDQRARVRSNPCNIVPFKRPLKNVNNSYDDFNTMDSQYYDTEAAPFPGSCTCHYTSHCEAGAALSAGESTSQGNQRSRGIIMF